MKISAVLALVAAGLAMQGNPSLKNESFAKNDSCLVLTTAQVGALSQFAKTPNPLELEIILWPGKAGAVMLAMAPKDKSICYQGGYLEVDVKGRVRRAAVEQESDISASR